MREVKSGKESSERRGENAKIIKTILKGKT